MGGKHRAGPSRLWVFVMGAALVVLLTVGAAGYASGPGVSGFGGVTVTTPPPTPDTTPAYLIPMSPEDTPTTTTPPRVTTTTPRHHSTTTGVGR